MITNVTETITLESLPKNLFKSQTITNSGETLEDLAERKLELMVKDAIELGQDCLMAEVLPQLERPLLRLMLEETKWNQQKAAKILGINRNTLRKEIDTLGLKNQSGL